MTYAIAYVLVSKKGGLLAIRPFWLLREARAEAKHQGHGVTVRRVIVEWEEPA